MGRVSRYVQFGLFWVKTLFMSPGEVSNLAAAVWRTFRLGGVKLVVSRVLGKVSSEQAYRDWMLKFDSLSEADRLAIRTHITTLEYQPVISILMPVYNSPILFLRKAIESVRRQIYGQWQLCIADDGSEPTVREELRSLAAQDARIVVEFRENRGHISEATNTALGLATGPFVALLDHDDELAEHALYCVVEALNRRRGANLIYGDSDKMDGRGRRFAPHFKPDWNPDLFYCMNYVTHLAVIRTSVVRAAGGFRVGFEGSQDYDLFLRLIEVIEAESIVHIPSILYHWRVNSASVAGNPNAKKYAYERARQALREHFSRQGKEVRIETGFRQFHHVRYQLPESLPPVTLVTSTRDEIDLLSKLVHGLELKTDYPHLELIVIDNQSVDGQALEALCSEPRGIGVRLLRYPYSFNYAAINNLGVVEANSEIVGLINNDVQVLEADWLREMVAQLLRPEVGTVGAKLVYPNGTVQHAGVILGIGGIAGHAHRHYHRGSPGYVGRLQLVQGYSAVTGACLLTKKRLFEEVGGLDEEHLKIAYNDVDYCLKLRQRGYRVIYTPYAELRHIESASRGSEELPGNRDRFQYERGVMQERWGHRLVADPAYNPNLSMDREDFSLAFPPRVTLPWREQDKQCE